MATTLDEATCRALLMRVRSTAEPSWRELVGILWPELTRLMRRSRAMAVLARSDDHVHNAALLVLEKLGKDGCRAARLYDAWQAAHPEKSTGDWLLIVTTNVARDYVRLRAGRADRGGEAHAEHLDKRLLYSLATLLPDDDELPPAAMLSATSRHTAHELAAWAEERLPRDQNAALRAWLGGSTFEEIASELALGDPAEAKRLVRAAVAALRRHATAA